MYMRVAQYHLSREGIGEHPIRDQEDSVPFWMFTKLVQGIWFKQIVSCHVSDAKGQEVSVTQKIGKPPQVFYIGNGDWPAQCLWLFTSFHELDRKKTGYSSCCDFATEVHILWPKSANTFMHKSQININHRKSIQRLRLRLICSISK